VKAVGARLPRYDGIGHVTGKTVYVDDIRVPGSLWVKALRSPSHHAKIAKLDPGPAEAMKGVHAVVTHKDVPLNVYGHLSALGIPGDEPLLAEDDVRYLGQPIAVVAAESEELASAAADMAQSVALVPALTAEMVKDSINHMVDLMGQRESWRYHFMLHQFVSNTPTALAKVEARKQGGMDAVKREQSGTRETT